MIPAAARHAGSAPSTTAALDSSDEDDLALVY